MQGRSFRGFVNTFCDDDGQYFTLDMDEALYHEETAFIEFDMDEEIERSWYAVKERARQAS